MSDDMPKLKSYVLGYMFDQDLSRVLLIHKKAGPSGLVGKFNGIGGKVEFGESAHDAMIREANEEAGIQTHADMWGAYTVVRFSSDWDNPDIPSIVYCFRMQINKDWVHHRLDYNYETPEGVVSWHPLEPLVGWHSRSTEHNKFLLPMAAYCGDCPTTIDYQSF